MSAVTIDDARDRADTQFFGHPRALGWISFSEFWERFSYYGMQALLVLYLTHDLLLPDHIQGVFGLGPFVTLLRQVYGPLPPAGVASVIFGFYAGLVWVAPIFGGFLADQYLGRTRAIVGGAALMVCGHFLMAFNQSFLLALVCLLVGLGGFKGNLATQVGGLYGPGDQRAASGFQIYLLGIQLAGVMTPLVCGTLGEVFGWHWGFGAAGVGMLIGLCVYLVGRRRLPPEPLPARGRRRGGPPLSRRDLVRLAALVALTPVLGVVQIGALQIANAYVIWAEAGLQLTFFGFKVPVTWLQSIDGAATSLAILATLAFWSAWRRRRPEPDEMTKMALGGVFLALAPLALVLAAWRTAATGRPAELGFALLFEALDNIGWVNVFAVGIALFSRVAPESLRSTMVGVYYLSVFIGSVTVGWLGSLLGSMSATNFWLLHVGVAGAAALVMVAGRRPLGRLFAAEAAP